jgi:hypothetical protein
MHIPVWHWAGAVHGAIPPHVQPVVEHPSASAPQATQLPPPAPHAFGSLPGWQRPLPSQQPVHDVGSHTHAPPEQY